MNLKTKQISLLASEVEQQLVEFDIDLGLAVLVSSHIKATVETYVVMQCEEVELSTFMAVLLKDVLRQVQTDYDKVANEPK